MKTSGETTDMSRTAGSVGADLIQDIGSDIGHLDLNGHVHFLAPS